VPTPTPENIEHAENIEKKKTRESGPTSMIKSSESALMITSHFFLAIKQSI
jgi:hypothetical protein